jgi:RimJ/RimL family protein N-acetyltransferase
MNRIEPLTPNIDLGQLAYDLSSLLTDRSNKDIALEFPASVIRYTGGENHVLANLEETVRDCRPGVRQQFVAYSGERAVGMSVIRFADEVPDSVQDSWPNVSGFICNPFRNQGLGRQSLLKRLEVVEEQFGGHAWTQVKKENAPSNAVVRRCGFLLTGETDGSNIYTFHSSSR